MPPIRINGKNAKIKGMRVARPTRINFYILD
jgi:hypothetical protein